LVLDEINDILFYSILFYKIRQRREAEVGKRERKVGEEELERSRGKGKWVKKHYRWQEGEDSG
jgi:hypothetical protein